MGANAQTAVPVFTAGQVLTAAQVTQINTGVPVFATTTTRDAAFGGTGEKTLAEGQFAYIEDSNTTQFYDGAAWQSVGSGGIAIFNETQASGTQGGTNVAATWTKRTLNTTVVNGITSCTLTSSVISLPAGTYQIRIDTIAGSPSSGATPDAFRHRLRNTTAGTTIALSQSGYNGAYVVGNLYAPLVTMFTIASTSNFEIQYYLTNAVTTVGLGRASSIASIDEIYTQIQIEKVG